MITEDKVTELFCIADDFCKEFNAEIKKNAVLPSKDGKKRRNRAAKMSDAEIITIMLALHYNSFRNFKHYYCRRVARCGAVIAGRCSPTPVAPIARPPHDRRY